MIGLCMAILDSRNFKISWNKMDAWHVLLSKS